jgi:hypothetical protein
VCDPGGDHYTGAEPGQGQCSTHRGALASRVGEALDCRHEQTSARTKSRGAVEQRRAQLKRLLNRNKGNLIRYSGSFPDAIVLLAECIRLGLEGIVAKRKDAPYRSGPRSGWIKVKTEQWKTANKYRAKLFEKSARKMRKSAAPAELPRRAAYRSYFGLFRQRPSQPSCRETRARHSLVSDICCRDVSMAC